MASPRIDKVVAETKPKTVRASLLVHRGDYEWATQQYRSGKAIRDIADGIGEPRSKLFDYSSRKNISRDLSTEIHNRTNVLLAGDTIDMRQAIQPTSDEDIIAINATLQAALIREHRGDIRRMRMLALQLLNELEQQTIHADWYEDLGTILRSEDDKGTDKLNDAYKQVISTPGRTENLKKLAEILKILIALERQAFGMREDYEDSEIRRSKLAAATTQEQLPAVKDDYMSITRKFMAV